MTIFLRIPLLATVLCMLLLSSFSIIPSPSSTSHIPPAKKVLKKKQKKRLWRQRMRTLKKQKKPNNIVVGLYITFGVLILLPLLVLLGTVVTALGLPSLMAYTVGAILIGIGNLGAILAGLFAGATKNYDTQVLHLALWVLFGLNMAALLTFSLLYTLVFIGTPLLLFLIIGVAVIALFFLIWAILVHRKKQVFKQNSHLDVSETPN